MWRMKRHAEIDLNKIVKTLPGILHIELALDEHERQERQESIYLHNYLKNMNKK